MATLDQDLTPLPADQVAHSARVERLFRWLNDPADPSWERPAPTPAQRRHDVLGMLGGLLAGLLMMMLAKSIGRVIEGETAWHAYVAVAAMVAPLAVRRARPLLTLVVSSVLFLALSYFSPEASVSLTFQVAYFTAIYTAVAWARNRRALWLLAVLVLGEMTLWLVIAFTMTNAMRGASHFEHASGPMDPQLALVLFTAVMNIAYFGGALLIGRTSWRGALQRERARRRAEQLADQADELARRAVLDERIRIARELHDVVAHHISVIGIQAGAARRVLDASPATAQDALRQVEAASRQAVAGVRWLLQVVRHERGEEDGRAREPGRADVEKLAQAQQASGLPVQVHRTEGFLADQERIPAPLALSAYRCVQEALTNVVRHSTATTAQVTLRTGATQESSWVEIEVVDGGRPRPNTSGTGYGMRGIEERAALHHGHAEFGPREHEIGWRVRVRLPFSP